MSWRKQYKAVLERKRTRHAIALLHDLKQKSHTKTPEKDREAIPRRIKLSNLQRYQQKQLRALAAQQQSPRQSVGGLEWDGALSREIFGGLL